jgi:hypothetical protein
LFPSSQPRKFPPDYPPPAQLPISQPAHGVSTSPTASPQLVILYVVSLAILELPLFHMFVGSLIANFEFQAYLLAVGAFLFGLAYLAFMVRPLIMQPTFRASVNPSQTDS